MCHGGQGTGEGLGSACSRPAVTERRTWSGSGLQGGDVEGSSDSKANIPAAEGALPERPGHIPAGSAFTTCQDPSLVLAD